MLRKHKRLDRQPDGRKYRLALISLLILLAGFSMTYLSPVFVESFSQLVVGIGVILAAYNGGNVANKWVTNKNPLTGKAPDNTVIEGEEDNGNVGS